MKLTDKFVRSVTAPPKGHKIIYEERGFGLRITAGGVKAFILNYRVRATGKERRYTIGRYPDLSVAIARDEALRLRGEIALGGDPVNAQAAERDAPTVANLCARFEAEHVTKLRPGTQVDYRGILRIIEPALGKLKVAEVKYKHVDQLHRQISQDAKYRANRTLAVLSKMFALAIKWEMRPDNPCKGVERNQEHARKRYLDLKGDELARLNTALDEYRDQRVADVFRLLLVTGARCGEVRTAKWEQFDLKNGTWKKPAASTKQKTEHEIPLSAPARQLVAALPRQSEFLFPGRRADRPRNDLHYQWRSICKAAGITGLRIHDLRHSYASTLVSAGFSLPVIGHLLGHSQPQTTHRYAHLFEDPLRKATERAGAILAGPKASGGKVTKFPARAGK
jgi:integrase